MAPTSASSWAAKVERKPTPEPEIEPAAEAPAAPAEADHRGPAQAPGKRAPKARQQPAAGRRAAAPPPEPDPDPVPMRRRPPRVIKVPATFRLPPDCIDLLDDAVYAAADQGVRLTKEDAVAAAIRAHYGTG